MIDFISNFKNTSIVILLLSIFFGVFLVVINLREISDEKRVEEFFLYEKIDVPDYSNIQEFNMTDTLASLGKVGFVKGEFLVGFSLENLVDDLKKTYILEFSNPFFYKLNLYKVGINGELNLITEAGTSVESANSLIYPMPFVEFNYEDVNRSLFFAVIQSEDPIGFELVLEERSEYFKEYSTRMLVVHIYMGLMVALFLYNIILFFMISDRVYLYYSFYVLLIAMAQLSLLGFSYFYLLGQDPNLFSISIVGFPSMAGIFAVLFIKKFLKTSYFIPKLDKFLVIVIILFALAFLLRLSGVVHIS